MLFGREKELKIINEIINSDKSEFVAVYGRRRIGKTFLINQAFNNKFSFYNTGLFKRPNKEQLYKFKDNLNKYGLNTKKKLKNWYDAFTYLEELILKSNEKKKVIFLDELSWMYRKNSSMISALENFWNQFCSNRSDVILIIASSATSWTMDKVIHNKGGLYNRLTRKIELNEFSLKECKEFVKEKGITITDNDIIEGYMALGGVPYYWDNIKSKDSIYSLIDRLFLNNDAILKDEYEYLFSSLFEIEEPYIKVIEALAKKRIGLTRNEILEHTKLLDNGRFSKILKDLEACSFIRIYKKYNNNQEKYIQLIDNYILFYYNFIKNNDTDITFSKIKNTPKYNTWKGLSFELICLKHISQIKQALGISGVITSTSSFYNKNEDNKIDCQIDLVIDRDDHIVNICECKYSEYDYEITKSYYENLRYKMYVFSKYVKSNRAVRLVLITNNGLKRNEYATIISNVITSDDLLNH